MSLKQLLLEKKPSISQKWCDLTLKSYPEESQSFFRKKDQFGNPVGYAISEGVPALYDALVADASPEQISDVLDSIIRIRAIQDFSPSEAVGFIFALKGLIRQELGRKIRDGGLEQEWSALDEKIDRLALIGFDVYQKCRQQIYDMRVRDVKRRSERLLQMAGLAYKIPEHEEEVKEMA